MTIGSVGVSLFAAYRVQVVPFQIVINDAVGSDRETVDGFLRRTETGHGTEGMSAAEFRIPCNRILCHELDGVIFSSVRKTALTIIACRQGGRTVTIDMGLLRSVGILAFERQALDGFEGENTRIGCVLAYFIVFNPVYGNPRSIYRSTVLVEGVHRIVRAYIRGKIDYAGEDVGAPDIGLVGILVGVCISHSDAGGEPVRKIVGKIEPSGPSRKTAALDYALSPVESPGHEISRLSGLPGNRNVCGRYECGAGHLIYPVCVMAEILGIIYRNGRSAARIEHVCLYICDIVPVGDEFGRIHQIQFAGEPGHSESGLCSNAWLDGGSFLCSDYNDPVRSARAVDGRR